MERNADREDVLKAKDDDRAAFDRLVTRYYRMVYGLALSTTREVSASEDIAQEAFLQAWANLDRLRNADAFAPWLRSIARNIATSWVRSRKVRDHVAARYAQLPTTSEPANARLIEQEHAASVTNALSTLPAYLRDAVVLYHIEGQSAADAARALGIGKNALKVRLYRARRRMRAHLEREIEHYLTSRISEEKISRARSQIAFALVLRPVLPHSLAQPSTAVLSTSSSESTLAFSKLLGVIAMSAKGFKLTALGIALALLFALYLYTRPEEILNDQTKSATARERLSRGNTSISDQVAKVAAPTLATPKAAINAPVATVGGKVRDLDSGIPIKDAEISIRQPESRHSHRIVTKANGEYRSEALAPGDYELQCYPPNQSGYCHTPYREYLLRVVVAPDSALDGVDFVFSRGVTVSGHVTAESGGPIAGAAVVATSASDPGSFVRYTSETDARGAFEISGLHPGANADINATAEGYANETLRTIPLPVTGTKENLELILHPGSIVAGGILDELGSPVAHANLCLKGPGAYAEYCTTTDETGQFRLNGIDAADYYVCVFFPGRPRQEGWMQPRINNSDPVTPERITVNSAENLENLTVQALEEMGPQFPGLITGTVLDSTNLPIAEASVSGRGEKESSDDNTDSEGKFTLRYRGIDGEVDIAIFRLEAGSQLVQDVSIGTQNLQIKLPQTGEIAGQVLNATTGEPCTAFTIQLVSHTQPEVEWVYPYNREYTMYSLNGDYLFRGVQAGNYVLTAWAPHRGRQSIALQLKDGEIQEVDVHLGVPQMLHGIVIDKNSRKPVAEARIYLAALPKSIEHPELGHSGGVAQTDINGAFQIENLSEGQIQIGVVHTDYLPILETVMIAAEPAAEHTIALVRGGTVQGSVTREGVPVPNARVQLMVEVNGEKTLHRMTETDVTGKYVISALESGFYELVIWGPADYKQNVEVALGRDTTVNANF